VSTKAYTFIIIGAGLLLFIGGIFLGWNVKPVKPCPVIDSVDVQTDTIWLPSEKEYIVKWKDLPAETSTVDEETIKSSSIDSVFTSGLDAIRIKAEVNYNVGFDTFDWFMEIEHKDFDFHSIDTMRVYITETVVVQTTDPMWVLLSIAEFFLIILAIIF